MDYLTNVKELEIYPTSATTDETERRWSVMVYGKEHLDIHVDEIEINAKHNSGFKDPNTNYSNAFTYVTFDSPVGLKKQDNKLIVE